MKRWNKGFKYIGKLRNLTLPDKFRWPRDPEPFLDLTGTNIVIENGASISSGVYILTHSHQFDKSNWRDLKQIRLKEPTIIKKDAFIGTNTIILYRCKYIGKCSVIGAGSVVTKNVPDYEIWAGNPAKKIGKVRR